MDIKKLDNIPDGGGHKTLGRPAGRKTRSGVGYSYLDDDDDDDYYDDAVDDHSRLAYSEILTDEKKETAVGFGLRAHAFFAGPGSPFVTLAAECSAISNPLMQQP